MTVETMNTTVNTPQTTIEYQDKATKHFVKVVDMKTALACTLIGAYSLLRCAKWGLFDS